MSSHEIRPKWWQLYLTLPLLILLFALDSRLKLSARGHQALQIGIVLIVFGLVHLWIRANAIALSHLDQPQSGGGIWVIRIPPYKLSDLENENQRRPLLQLPNSEIKGTLSNTFEMDYIDVEFVSPMDEVAHDLKKE